MDRRKFIKSGSVAMAAMAGLPAAARSFNFQTAATVYRTKPVSNQEGQTLYEVSVFHNGFENFSSASDDEKIITVKVGYFAGSDLTKPTKEGEFRYIIKAASASSDSSPVWTIMTKLDKKVSGDYKFAKDFPKNMRFRCSKYSSVEIMTKDGDKTLVTVPYPSQSSSSGSSSGGCFLTTACVAHRGLSDNCVELETLRSLRDGFMVRQDTGVAMINEYKTVGPAIVKAIDSCDNHEEIYNYMYTQMIQPSVQLVQEGKLEEAVAYYKAFVKALMRKYN